MAKSPLYCTSSVPPLLTVILFCGVDGVELANVGDQGNVNCGRTVVPCVVTGSTRDTVRHGRLEAVLVEQARDARGGHAPPGVSVRLEKPRNDGNPRISCRYGIARRTCA